MGDLLAQARGAAIRQAHGAAPGAPATRRMRAQDVAQARRLLEGLAEYASPALQADLSSLLAEIEGFAGRTPLEISQSLTAESAGSTRDLSSGESARGRVSDALPAFAPQHRDARRRGVALQRRGPSLRSGCFANGLGSVRQQVDAAGQASS